MDKKNTIDEFNIKFGNFAGLQSEVNKLKEKVFNDYKGIIENNTITDLPYTMLFPLVYLTNQEFYTHCRHWCDLGYNYSCPDTIMAIKTILETDIALRYGDEGLSKTVSVKINRPQAQVPVTVNVTVCRFFEKKSVDINETLFHDDTTVKEYFNKLFEILV